MTQNRVSLALRNLFFTVLQPGIVAGAIPWFITKKDIGDSLPNAFLFRHYVGIVIFLVGLVIMFHCIIRFAIEGFGTLSPADPTKRLVISGLYKFSRNPMYVGVMMILIGEVIFSLSVSLLIYSIGIFILFNLFIVYREEPRLRRDFGKEYDEYITKVRRWI
jgi:protein-S-isoprenylcysteine O-methyltransferase Ste14